MTRAPQRSAWGKLLRQIGIGLPATLTVIAGCTRDAGDPGEQITYTATPRAPYSSGEYSSTRLILRISDGAFEVVSSTPSFGGVTETNVAEAVPDILDGSQALYEYIARDSGGAVLAQSYFTVQQSARATFTEDGNPERVHHVEVENPSTVFRLAIPFVPDVATVEFRALVPDENRSYELWDAASAGSVQIELPQPEAAP